MAVVDGDDSMCCSFRPSVLSIFWALASSPQNVDGNNTDAKLRLGGSIDIPFGRHPKSGGTPCYFPIIIMSRSFTDLFRSAPAHDLAVNHLHTEGYLPLPNQSCISMLSRFVGWWKEPSSAVGTRCTSCGSINRRKTTVSLFTALSPKQFTCCSRTSMN